ncbi:MAG TPA: serine hydrolase domain-containing protein [Gemmatimonadales bacterium]
MFTAELLPETLPRHASAATPHRGSAFSRNRLARLHDALRRHVDRGEAPGLVALLDIGGREHVEVIGTTAFDGVLPMERDTIFRLASTTKPVTAAGAMVLVEECRLRLDDPLDEWLPELAGRRVLRTVDSPLDDTVPAARSITLRDLLTFRSGYGEAFFVAPGCPFGQALSERGLSLAEWPFAGTPDEFMARLGELPLLHQPGERWLYHTSGEILGVLIGRVAGMRLGEFLRERIFEPLGMVHTGFSVPPAELDRLPPCYGRDPMTGDLAELFSAGGGYAAGRPPFESGAGGLVSTADDLRAFGRMMLGTSADVGRRLLSRPALELMTRDHLTEEQKAASPFFPGFWAGYGWGLGLAVTTSHDDVGVVPGRFGWDGAFGTSLWMDPRRDLVGVLMMQRRPDRFELPLVARDFWTSVYQLIDT